MTGASAFWDDLALDLEDPEFLRECVVESVRIATLDEVVNALDDSHEAAGLSKAELARAIRVEVDAAWSTEFRRRLDDIDSGRVALVSGEESDARVRALLADLHQ